MEGTGDLARWTWAKGRAGHTFCEVLDADVVELLDLLHDEVLLVDLDDDRGVAGVAAREAELAEGGLELLGDVDGAGLRAGGVRSSRAAAASSRAGQGGFRTGGSRAVRRVTTDHGSCVDQAGVDVWWLESSDVSHRS